MDSLASAASLRNSLTMSCGGGSGKFRSIAVCLQTVAVSFANSAWLRGAGKLASLPLLATVEEKAKFPSRNAFKLVHLGLTLATRRRGS